MSVGRREFLAGATATIAGLWLPSCSSAPARRTIPPGGKLRVGFVGVGGRGGDNLDGLKDEDVIALCDVDSKTLAEAAEKFPAAKRFADYRDLLALPELDAVVVSTADHTHAAAAAAALRRNLDVYCEKPLTHDIGEARFLRALARERGAVTQMGIQIHDHENFRRVVELVRAGVLGELRGVHVFVNGSDWSAAGRAPKPADPPATLDYDLWLGPAAARPFDPEFHPAGWRRFWSFGNGTMGDMACHHMDLAFWALELGAPTTIEARGPSADPDGAPDRLEVHYAFPARGDRPPVTLVWYDGKRRPPILAQLGLEKWVNGVLFVGEKGFLVANYDRHELGPKESWTTFTPPPPSIPQSIGHHREWAEACKSRGPTTCGFDYSAPLTEAVLLGCLSHRIGKKLEWDGERGEIRNVESADRWLRPPRRNHWEL